MRTPFVGRSSPRRGGSVSRRRFLHIAAGTVGALGAGLLWPNSAPAAGRDPKPIPGGFANPTGGPFVHLNIPPGPTNIAPGDGDPISITDFDGLIGAAQVQGTGTGTNTDTGETSTLLFDSDLRFMQGV